MTVENEYFNWVKMVSCKVTTIEHDNNQKLWSVGCWGHYGVDRGCRGVRGVLRGWKKLGTQGLRGYRGIKGIRSFLGCRDARDCFGHVSGHQGCKGVRGVLWADRDSRYSGARRGIGGIRGLWGLLGVWGAEGLFWGHQGV